MPCSVPGCPAPPSGTLRLTLVRILGRAVGHRLPEARCRATFVQLCGALHYCHRNGVVHRDIKLDNLVWVDPQETRLQLVDFGYAAAENEQRNFAGSPHYAAPEVHRAKDERPETPSFLAAGTDVWSCGVCLFAMLATQLPFGGDEESEEDQRQLTAKVCAGAWDVSLADKCSEDAIDLVSGMLAVDPEKRLSLDDVCEHRWIGGLDHVPWEALG